MRLRRVLCSAVFFLLTLGLLLEVAAEDQPKRDGSMTVIYNHEGPDSETGLVRRGGFSVYVQLGEQTVLFDVGGEASVILENVQRSKVSLSDVDAVVISHNHWDHVYGLPGVMSGSRTKAPVYVAASAAGGIRQQFPRATVVPVQDPQEILPRVWTTGALEAEVLGSQLSEQALVLEHPDGLHVLVGCSHPGIVKIAERVREMFPKTPIALVGGGFHLRSTAEDEIERIADHLERLGVRRIAPSHCSGDLAKAVFRERWGEGFVSLGLGQSYRF